MIQFFLFRGKHFICRGAGTHLVGHTSTDWCREVPHGSVSGVGDTGERGVAV